jgi:hypothetical protein
MYVTSQPLDNKTLNRLESAVAKSQYVGAGKKLKVTNQVSIPTTVSQHREAQTPLTP